MVRSTFLLLLALLVSAAPTVARAQAAPAAQPSPEDDEEARATFRAATLAFGNGHYEDAYGLFKSHSS